MDDRARRQTVRVEVGGGASIHIEVWQDEVSRWRACAPTHYPSLPTVTAATPVEALVEVGVAAMHLMSRRMLEGLGLQAKIDATVEQLSDPRPYQFAMFYQMLDFAERHGPEALKEVVGKLLKWRRELTKATPGVTGFDEWMHQKLAPEGKSTFGMDAYDRWMVGRTRDDRLALRIAYGQKGKGKGRPRTPLRDSAIKRRMDISRGAGVKEVAARQEAAEAFSATEGKRITRSAIRHIVRKERRKPLLGSNK